MLERKKMNLNIYSNNYQTFTQCLLICKVRFLLKIDLNFLDFVVTRFYEWEVDK